jgi:DNA-binding NarL/FixJ family response regulator
LNPISTIRLLIADGQDVFRAGLKTFLNYQVDIQVIGEASNGEILLQKVIELKPNIVLTDVRMSILDGVLVTKEIIRCLPETKVIATAQYAKDDIIIQMLDAGVLGFVSKTAHPFEIIEAIKTVFMNKPYFCDEITSKLTKIVERKYQLRPKLNIVFTDREVQIIKLICKEYTSKEIAHTLSLSKRTIEGHRTRIMDRVGAKSIAGIITYAVEFGVYHRCE